MIKTLAKGLILSLFSVSLLALAAPAMAATPVLSASFQSGSSGNVQVTVTNADTFAQVNLYTRQSSSLWTVVNNLGQTDGSGYFSQVVNLPGDGSNSPIQLYVVVNGQQSAVANVNSYGGCTYNCGTSGISLSQTNLSLNVGNSSTVTIYNSGYYSGGFYLASNSNQSVASASISGNSLSVSALAAGNTTINVCGSSSQCALLYVTVSGGSYGSGSLWFNPASPSMYVGQSLAVAINSSVYSSAYSYSNNAYSVSSNSNPNVVGANISGTVLNLNAYQTGSSIIRVCHLALGFCGSLTVTVGSGSNNNLTLSQSSLTLTVGQTASVTASGVSSVYISNNSNQNVVSATISGTQINLSALAAGSSNITVCGNSFNCAPINVTVNSVLGASTANVSIVDNSYSPKVITIPVGGSITWTNNGSMVHTVTADDNSFNSGNIAVGGNFVKTFNIAGTYNYHCIYHGSVGGAGMSGTVVVSGGVSGSGISLSQSNLTLTTGQYSNLNIYGNGNNGNYYLSNNTNQSVVSATISGSTLYLNALSAGSSNITVCQNYPAYSCATVYVTVTGYTGSGSVSLSQNNVSLNAGQTATVSIYNNNGNSGYYYVSSNTGPGVVSATVSGSTLNLTGLASGNATLSICQSYGSQCATLYVSVGNAYGINVTLNPVSLTLAVGQTGTVNASGGGGFGFYLGNNSNPGVVSPSFNGSALSVYALKAGSATLQVCQNNASSCANLYVTVTGSNVLGANTYNNGQLISEFGTVYIIYKNTKSGFSSGSVFTGLGYKFSNVLEVGNSGIPDTGYVISTSRAAHPWGSWIKSGSAVYFVHESGLIPIPNWSTFLNNGGQAAWIVSANGYDFQRPMLSPMVSNDSRLQ